MTEIEESRFEKSRVINFTDAVFSIAMTLLVLEIGIPSAQTMARRESYLY